MTPNKTHRGHGLWQRKCRESDSNARSPLEGSAIRCWRVPDLVLGLLAALESSLFTFQCNRRTICHRFACTCERLQSLSLSQGRGNVLVLLRESDLARLFWMVCRQRRIGLFCTLRVHLPFLVKARVIRLGNDGGSECTITDKATFADPPSPGISDTHPGIQCPVVGKLWRVEARDYWGSEAPGRAARARVIKGETEWPRRVPRGVTE